MGKEQEYHPSHSLTEVVMLMPSVTTIPFRVTVRPPVVSKLMMVVEGGWGGGEAGSE